MFSLNTLLNGMTIAGLFFAIGAIL